MENKKRQNQIVDVTELAMDELISLLPKAYKLSYDYGLLVANQIRLLQKETL